MTAGQIAARFAHAWPTTTRHLNVLAEAGLVTRRRSGKEVFYAVDPARVAVAEEWLAWLRRPPGPPDGG